MKSAQGSRGQGVHQAVKVGGMRYAASVGVWVAMRVSRPGDLSAMILEGTDAMMETIRLVIVVAGSVCLLFGYLLLISDEKGHVNLNNYRFTGGLGLVFNGILVGLHDVWSGDLTRNGVSALAICLGLLLLLIGFSV